MTEIDTILTSRARRTSAAWETIDPDPARSWKWLDIVATELSVPHHRHDAWELLYVIAGQLLANVAGECTLLEAGDAQLIDPGRPHGFSTPDGASPTRVVVAVFRHDFLGARLWDVPEFRSADRLFRLAPFTLFGRHEVAVSDAWRELVDAPTWQRTTRLLDVVVTMSRASTIHSMAPTAANEADASSMDAVMETLRAGYRNRITLEQLAQQAHFSPSGLSRAFRRAFGRTISDELRRLRMAEGAKLLVSTDWSVARIAATCGAGSAANFGRSFRIEFGATPGAYRARSKASRWAEGS